MKFASVLSLCFSSWILRARASQDPELHPKWIGRAERLGGIETQSRKTIDDMACEFFSQPLNHFVPRETGPTYFQRFCFYDDFASSNVETPFEEAPIFFYTGNESPLETYINHTGLMWELAPVFHARVVFAEHRYEGMSLPLDTLDKDCMSYASTMQAVADYADLIQLHLNREGRAPVIVFGGSYGGMLSAWMRMKYPHLVDGAIAASAPLGAFPQVANKQLDWASRVIAHGMQQSYPPNKKKDDQAKNQRDIRQSLTHSTSSSEESNHCVTNMLAIWPLITWLVQQKEATFLQETLGLCEPYSDPEPDSLIEFATSLWFLLAEGSFPYPSNYIPFAIIHKTVDLPAWPLQAACWKTPLHKDWGVRLQGDVEDVMYNISYGESQLELQIDWGQVSAKSSPMSDSLKASKTTAGLLGSLREAIGVWYNITNDVTCYNVSEVAPNRRKMLSSPMRRSKELERSKYTADFLGKDTGSMCHNHMKQVGSWEPLCCNDEMNLVITEARGLGHDFFWPPSLPRNIKSYEDLVKTMTFEACPDPDGIYGYSKKELDPWSWWLETYFGSSKLTRSAHSNIIFSNGLLDPWAAGGIYKEHPFATSSYDGPMLQNISDGDLIALLIEHGGHHTDLMYSDKMDPASVTWARNVETSYIQKWISEFRTRECQSSQS